MILGQDLQADGKFIGASPYDGGTFCRHNADGSLDTTYGNGGCAQTSIFSGYSRYNNYQFALQPDGKLVIAGNKDEALAAQRFNADGSNDIGFGESGVVKSTLLPTGDNGETVVVHPNGKIIVAGMRNIPVVPPATNGYYFVAMQILPDGTLDSTFGSAGIKTIEVSWYGTFKAASIDTAGDIYIGGNSSYQSKQYTFLTKLVGDPIATVPDVLLFDNQTNVERNKIVSSNAIIISGLSENTSVPVTINNGDYSINGGSYISINGWISNGDSISVRHKSGASFGATTTTTLKVGGMASQSNPVYNYGPTVPGVGNARTVTFTTTTEPVDTSPDAFGFTTQNDVPFSSVATSNTIKITGINTPAPISIKNGEYSTSCNGTFITNAGTINPNQTVCVRHTASNQFSGVVQSTLSVGGVSGTFKSVAVAEDLVPDPFTIASKFGVGINSYVYSDPLVVTGINSTAHIQVTNGEYSVGCGDIYTADPGVVLNGEEVCVRQHTPTLFSKITSMTLDIGGVQTEFTTTTIATDA